MMNDMHVHAVQTRLHVSILTQLCYNYLLLAREDTHLKRGFKPFDSK